MARPERNNVDYFPHPVTHGKKMFYLRSKYKNDGYAVWFILLEELGKADHHYLNFNDETQIMFLASEMMVGEDIIIGIIEALIKFGEFDYELWEQKVLFCSKFVESIEDAYSRRNNNVLHKEGLCKHLLDKGVLKHSKCKQKGGNKPQSKVKDSKVDKSRVEKVPVFEDFKNYALENKPNINIDSLELKYKSWVENNWKDGNGKKIINWRSKLLNTLPYIKDNGTNGNWDVKKEDQSNFDT